MILLVSTPRDQHAREVLARLQRMKMPASLLDLSQFSAQGTVTLRYDGHAAKRGGVLDASGVRFDLQDCRLVWWRRPQAFVVPPEVSAPVDHAFAYGELHEAFSGMWLSLDAFWINHPTRDEEAARKVYQLRVAQEIGFRIPETCITSDPVQAREFIERQGDKGTIYKAFSGTERAWRETRLLRPEELDKLQSVRYAPVIFQEYIPAAADLRITMVDGGIFPAAIYSGKSSYPTDFRMAMDESPMEPTQLPDDIEEKLRALMAKLGVVYGAIDMRLTPDGEYVFLEINPSGQWLFVESRTGLAITDAIVGTMARRARSS